MFVVRASLGLGAGGGRGEGEEEEQEEEQVGHGGGHCGRRWSEGFGRAWTGQWVGRTEE